MTLQVPQPYQIRPFLVDRSLAFHTCVLDGSPPVLRQVLSTAANIDLELQHDKWGTPLHVAVWINRPSVAEALIVAGAGRLIFNYGGGSGDKDAEWSPLSLAAALGHRDILKLILQHLPRTRVMEHSERRWCPLVSAAFSRHVSIVEDLVVWQPPWPQSILDQTLLCATHRWQPHVVRILLIL